MYPQPYLLVGPREQPAQLLADGLDLVVFLCSLQLVVVRVDRLVLGDLLLGEGAILYLFEDFLHLLAGVIVDDAVTASQPVVFGRIRD